MDPKQVKDFEASAEVTPTGAVLRFNDIEVPDWINTDLPMHELMVFVYCRGLKVGDAELEAEAQLVAPGSAPVRTSYPVTVLPEMWHPLKGSERSNMIQDVLALHRRARLNGLAVLRGGPDEAVSALRRALETWRSLVGPAHKVHRRCRNGRDCRRHLTQDARNPALARRFSACPRCNEAGQ